MKRSIRMLSLALLLVLALAACGGTAEAPAEEEAAGTDMAGHYILYGYYNQGDYIYNDIITGYIDLEKDGTGYLDWGEDNRGPITGWTADGEKLSFQAGVAAISGTVKDVRDTLLLNTRSPNAVTCSGILMPSSSQQQ